MAPESVEIKARHEAYPHSMMPPKPAKPLPQAARLGHAPPARPGTGKSTLAVPFGTVGAVMFFSLLFLTISRFHEVLRITIGVNTRIFTAVALAAVLFAIVSGRWPLAWKSVPGLLLLAMTFWIFLGVPFSIWKGGSVKEIRTAWIPSMLTFMVTASMIYKWRDMRRTIYICGFSIIVILAAYYRLAVLKGGRVAFVLGTLGNSNDMAMHLLFGLPFLMFIIADQKRITIPRVLAFAAIPVLLRIVVGTGSRAGLLGIMSLLVAAFFIASFMGKLKLAVVVTALGTALLATAPDYVTSRYKTLLDDDGGPTEAEASAEGRMRLLQESVRQTILNPVFGVGIGNFPSANARALAEKGIYFHAYRASHNTYTQISSEIGIPGFVCFFSIFIWCFRENLRLYKRTRLLAEHKPIERAAICLFLSWLAFSVTTFFGSNAYTFYVPVLAGLTVSLKRIAEELLPPVNVYKPANSLLLERRPGNSIGRAKRTTSPLQYGT